MNTSPRILRERNAKLIDKLKQNQEFLRKRRTSKTPEVTPAKKVAEAKQKLLEKRSTRKRSYTSTPISTPKKRTPQSILKKRKIIDRNVRVGPDKSLDITPDNNFNFSYVSSVKSPDNVRKQKSRADSVRDMDRKGVEGDKLGRKEERPKDLLKDAGNSRSAVNYEQDKTRRSTYLAPLEETKTGVNRVTFNTSLSRTYSNMYDDQREEVPAPMLGYDWIAGALDNTKSALDKSDEYFDDILTFRRQNKDICVSSQAYNGEDGETSDVTGDSSSHLEPRDDHTCIHTYVVNDRLFPQPLNKTENGLSACPVCRKPKKDPTSTSPAYVRVSLPARHLQEPYKVVPHRRRSFDPSDSCALSQHVMAGMESSRPSCLKAAHSLDMRTALLPGARSKLTQDSEVDKIIREEKLHYQAPPPLTRARLAALNLKSQHQNITRNKNLNNSDKNQKKSVQNRIKLSEKTQNLLNTSISLRHQAQKFERSTHAQPAGNSTRYPAGS